MRNLKLWEIGFLERIFAVEERGKKWVNIEVFKRKYEYFRLNLSFYEELFFRKYVWQYV